MCDLVFATAALRLSEQLSTAAAAAAPVEIEAKFSQLTLDIIGQVWGG